MKAQCSAEGPSPFTPQGTSTARTLVPSEAALNNGRSVHRNESPLTRSQLAAVGPTNGVGI